MNESTLLELRSPIVAGMTRSIDGRRLRNGFTVEALIETTAACSEGMQSLVSIWSPRESFDAFSAFDAGRTDGLDTGGYFGAVFDGRYVYFVPEYTEKLVTHAMVLRYDTHGDFKDPRSFAAYDAGRTAGLDTRGYYGGAFDGRYVYFIPRQFDKLEYHTHILRLDTRGEFKDAKSWDAFDIGPDQSAQGCAFDGRYLYLCPGYYGDVMKEEFDAGTVIRYDTRATFKDRASYQGVDVKRFLGPDAACFDGAAFDGRHIYFVPLKGVPVRYDTHGSFDAASSWQRFESSSIGMSIGVGAIFDGRWMYYVAYANSRMARFDTTGDFTNPKCWQIRDVDHTGGLRTCGFDGGFFDGRYVTYVPFVYGSKEEGYTLQGNFLRYDTHKPFDQPASWQARDAHTTDGLLTIGFNAGVFDGRFYYAAPWRSVAGRGPAPGSKASPVGVNGRVLRYDSTGERATFALRACDLGHNGGLCAALPGPSFLINTTAGVRSVAAHRALGAGRHKLVGRYDGVNLTLHVDGELAATRDVSALLVVNDLPVVFESLGGGSAAYTGAIHRVAIRAMT